MCDVSFSGQCFDEETPAVLCCMGGNRQNGAHCLFTDRNDTFHSYSITSAQQYSSANVVFRYGEIEKSYHVNSDLDVQTDTM